MSGFEEEESEWNTSKIKGFSFGDDEETPWAELAKYQTISDGASGSKDSNYLVSFESGSAASGASVGIVSDRVKKAARIFTANLPQHFESGSARISDVVGSSSDYIPTDPGELRSELSKARRQLAKLENSKFRPLHPRETVLNIFYGKPFALEFYKSFQDKIDLIDEALKLQDGDAILTVILFLRKTLSDSKFLEVASTRPVAVRHLSDYLEESGQLSQLTDLLTSLGENEKAALVQYKNACKVKDLESRSRRIKSVLNHHFVGNQTDQPFVVAHSNLLERILPVYEADKRNPSIANDQRVASLNSGEETLLDTLLYFCYHHYESGENLLSSPKSLKLMHKIGEQQFIWTALAARAKRKNWKDCQELAISRGWFSGKKGKASVDPKGVVRILYDNEAPILEVQTFLQLIEDIDDRKLYAQRYHVPTVVVDCLLLQKDRLGLQKLLERLTPNSSEWCYTESALNTSNTKWKN